MRAHTGLLLLLLLLGSAQAGDDEELALAFGDAGTVSIATGATQPLRRAPAVASVFTADDIRAMGATDLMQVLQRVPGLHIGRTIQLYDPQFQLRGVQSPLNQQVLVLIDGVRRQSPTTGGPGDPWVDMPVENIARIEVIRGPGSALYGADAVSGVIAISTWRGNELPGWRSQLNLGSYGSRSASLQQGGQAGDWRWQAHLRLGRTQGPNEVIAADAQSALDAVFGSQASLAPGSLHYPHRAVDAGLQLANGAWRLQASLKQRRGVGSGPGLAQALSGRDRIDSELAVLALGYQQTNWLPDWDLQAQASLMHDRVDTWLQLFPPGAFGGLYPEGMIGAPGRSTRTKAFEAVTSYQGFASHRLRFGLGVQDYDLYATRERKNFSFVVLPGVGPFPAPLGSLVDVSQSDPYLRPRQRRLHYLLLQDEWQLAPDWTLTTGLRHDRFSDFGATTNPRLALVWDARHDLTLKLLHGRAFRAPSFSDLHTTNNPVVLGNPLLKPERMATSELVLDWQPQTQWHASLNLFRYRLRDIISAVPNADPTTGSTSQNQGSQTGRGFEAELSWQAASGWRLDASVSQQHSTDELNRQDAGYAPRRLLKLALDGQLAANWHLHAQALQVAGRRRASGDARPLIADYISVDLALHWRRASREGWQLMLALRNALDADVREPSPAPGNIPQDFPQPGRNWQLQLGYRL